ncbi:hypothetical protein GCM10027168_44010 [Streptomyces capparidis]
MRAAAQKDPALVTQMIEWRGEACARRLFTHALVDQVLRLRETTAVRLHTWEAV